MGREKRPFWHLEEASAAALRNHYAPETGTADWRRGGFTRSLAPKFEWEKTATSAERGAVTEAQLRKYTGELLHCASVRDFFEDRIRIKEGAKSQNCIRRRRTSESERYTP